MPKSDRSDTRLLKHEIGCRQTPAQSFLGTSLHPQTDIVTGVPRTHNHVRPVKNPRFGQEGTGPGQFKSPIGIAINAADDVFITDASNSCVQRFTSDGKFLDKVATGSFPGGIAIDAQGLIYVAVMMNYKISVFRHKPNAAVALAFDREDRVWVSATNHRVQLFTADGHYLTGLGTTAQQGHNPGQFRVPHGMAFDSHGVLYVVDTQDHRVQKFAFDAGRP